MGYYNKDTNKLCLSLLQELFAGSEWVGQRKERMAEPMIPRMRKIHTEVILRLSIWKVIMLVIYYLEFLWISASFWHSLLALRSLYRIYSHPFRLIYLHTVFTLCFRYYICFGFTLFKYYILNDINSTSLIRQIFKLKNVWNFWRYTSRN